MHSVFNRTNNDNGIAAALLNGQLYRLGILIAVVVHIAALALLEGADGSARPTGWNLTPILAGWRVDPSTPQTAVGFGDDILDVTTDQQEIPPCNMIKWTQ